MNDLAGDGTSTAIILARAMIRNGLSAVAFGANPISLKKGMEKTVKDLVKFLKKKSVPVEGRDHIKGLSTFACLSFVKVRIFFAKKVLKIFLPPSFAAIASISAGNDEYVGNLIAEAIEKIGSDGVISIESSSSSETFVIIEEGMKVLMMVIMIAVLNDKRPFFFPRSK